MIIRIKGVPVVIGLSGRHYNVLMVIHIMMLTVLLWDFPRITRLDGLALFFYGMSFAFWLCLFVVLIADRRKKNHD